LSQTTSEQGLWLVFAIGVALVLLSVAIVFDSVWGAAMVFLSLPVALGGVMAAFWMAGRQLHARGGGGGDPGGGARGAPGILLIDAALRAEAGARCRQLHRLPVAHVCGRRWTARG
jgi:multidrug efflux pump subunit AcrB